MAYGNTSYGGGSGAPASSGSVSSTVVVPCPNIAIASGIKVRVDTTVVRPCPNITVANVWTVTGVSQVNATFKGDQDTLGHLKNRPRVIGTPESIWPLYRLVVVDVLGTRYGSLDNATITSASWVLNDDGGFVFTMPSNDPKAQLLQAPQREVQLWCGKTLIHWGVVNKVRANAETAEFSCVGLGWYFTRRVIGPMPILSLLKNGSFDANDATAHWKRKHNTWMWVGGVLSRHPVEDPIDNVTWSVSKSVKYVGIRSLKLSQNVTNHNSWVEQTVAHPTNLIAKGGDKFVATAWVNITKFKGPAYKKRGLYIEAVGATSGKTYASGTALITSGTPRNKWVRLRASLLCPKKSETINIIVKLYPPNGDAYFDEVRLTYNQRLEFNDYDEAKIVRALVWHAQGKTWDTGDPDPSLGKSDLHIGVSCPKTGITRDKNYNYYDHEVIRDLIDYFPTLHNGVDWDIAITPTTRTFRTHFPWKGVDHRKNKDFVLALNSNIDTYTVDVDANDVANKVSVTSMNIDNDGSAREEASASDTGYLGGLVLEKVFDATPMSAIQSLQAQANRGVARYKKPVIIPTVTSVGNSAYLLGFINTGDWVPVRLKDGWVNASADYRVTKIDLDPVNDSLTFSLVPADSAGF